MRISGSAYQPGTIGFSAAAGPPVSRAMPRSSDFNPTRTSRPSPVFPLQTTEAFSSSPGKRRVGPFGAPPVGGVGCGPPQQLFRLGERRGGEKRVRTGIYWWGADNLKKKKKKRNR